VTTVVVSGAVANKHGQGGSIWVRMSWVEAFRQLGFDVVFIEELHDGGSPEVFSQVLHDFGVPGALLTPAGLIGMSADELHARLDDAVLLVNLSGHLRRPELLQRVRRRAFVDLDPGYTQIWHHEGHDVGVEDHDLHFTVGVNIGTKYSTIPAGSIRWLPVRQPVVLERWPVTQSDFSSFTTVASWRGAYGPLTWRGRSYGVKAHQFRRFLDVPSRTRLPFQIALDLHPADAADRRRLRRHGWRVTGSESVATTASFADYVRSSGAEFSVAQGVYVETCSGWFSDRTVRYLASGRPALVQETGFSRILPVGDGLLSFRTPDEAADRARAIVDDYATHALAARRITEEHFSPAPALATLLDATGISP